MLNSPQPKASYALRFTQLAASIVPLVMTVVTFTVTPVHAGLTESWALYPSTNGGYSIRFPVEPKTDARPVEKSAASLTLHSMSETAESGTFFESAYGDLPDSMDVSDADAILLRAENGSIENVHAHLVSHRALRSHGIFGRDLRARARSQGVSVDIYEQVWLKGSRLYELVLVAPHGSDSAATAKAFFTSFHIQQ